MNKAKLISITPNYMELLTTAAGKCYNNKVGAKGIEKIIEAGHVSVLEHCSASFEVECSVRVLGQLTRHRHLSFTVQSSRGSEFTEMTTPNLHGSMHEQMLSAYHEALGNGMSYEDAAYLLPQGAMTKLVVTGNFRAWFEYLPKRMCKRALAEHRELAFDILMELVEAAPEVFDRDFMNCKACKEHSCSFSHTK